jgi:hypothetical protein
LKIELFRNKVTTALASAPESELMSKPTHERLPLYKLLNADWSVLEATLGTTDGMCTPRSSLNLSAIIPSSLVMQLAHQIQVVHDSIFWLPDFTFTPSISSMTWHPKAI